MLQVLTILPKVLYHQLFTVPPAPHFDCSGQIFIVTGGNTGLGKEAARHFVDSGAVKVILACRSIQKGEEAKEDLEASTERKGVIEVWQLDLQSYKSVDAFAERVKQLDRVDVLLQNAAINTQTFTLVEGNESTITTNVVSQFLLAILLLSWLRAMGKRHAIVPRITFVSSEVHGFTSFPERKAPNILDGLNDDKTARMVDRYNVSKLIGLLACLEIVKNQPVDKLGVILNLTNPGLCQSNLMREMDSAAVRQFQKTFGRTAEVGSRALVHVAMQGSDSHGVYFNNCHPAPLLGFARSKERPAVQKKVATELAMKLEQIHPGIKKNLES